MWVFDQLQIRTQVSSRDDPAMLLHLYHLSRYDVSQSVGGFLPTTSFAVGVLKSCIDTSTFQVSCKAGGPCTRPSSIWVVGNSYLLISVPWTIQKPQQVDHQHSTVFTRLAKTKVRKDQGHQDRAIACYPLHACAPCTLLTQQRCRSSLVVYVIPS